MLSLVFIFCSLFVLVFYYSVSMSCVYHYHRKKKCLQNWNVGAIIKPLKFNSNKSVSASNLLTKNNFNGKPFRKKTLHHLNTYSYQTYMA